MRIKYGSNKSSKWSCDSLRTIHYDGEPLFYVHRLPDLTPEDADDLAEYITFLLNEDRATPKRGRIKIISAPGRPG